MQISSTQIFDLLSLLAIKRKRNKNTVNTKTLDKNQIISLSQTLILLTVAVTAPYLGHISGQQFITGPIVNTTLFLAIILLGIRKAYLIALIPSCIALSTGFLPASLLPMLPFIMISNIIMMEIFKYFKSSGKFFTGIVISAFIKFIFLYSVSLLILENFLKAETAQSVASMMNYPQFITAITGGLLAWTILRFLKQTSAEAKK